MKMCAWFLAATLATPAAAQTASPGHPPQDARLDAAIHQGVAALPAFDSAVAKHLKTMLDVRVPYGDGQSEFVWLGAVQRNTDGSYDGIVLNPVAHADLTQGAFYHARRDQVVDWVFEDDKGDHGGATVKLMRERDPKHVDGFHFTD